MLAPEQRNALLKRAEKSFASIHKGLGVRRPDLRTRLGPELRTLWQVADLDSPQVVLAKTVIRLEDLLTELSDDSLSMVVPTSYNFSLDLETSRLPLSGRQKSLATQEGESLSERTVQRRIEEFQTAMGERLRRCFDPIPQERVEVTILREQRPISRDQRTNAPRAQKVCRSVQRLYSQVDPAEEAIHDFLGAQVHIPTPAVVSTFAFGRWLCVFSDGERLTTYRQATNAPWTTRPAVRTGADLARQISADLPGVGILLNPAPRRDGDPGDTLMLPPETVRSIA
jgi:hypothetical protein